MESMTPSATPTPDAAILRKLAELQEHQSWAHHVADAATGKLLTTPLDRPVAPLSRAKRLSELGHQFDTSIFGTPTYRLTPRHPYQASPTGFLGFLRAVLVSSYGDDPEGHATWNVSEDIVGERVGQMSALMFAPPQGRCLITLLLGAINVPGQVGRIRIKVEALHPEAHVIASFGLAVHSENFVWHTFDLGLVITPPPIPSHSVTMILEPGSGLDFVSFRSFTLAPKRPGDIGS